MNEDQREKCNAIAKHYGKRKQKLQAIQELTELIMELTKRDDQKQDRSEYISKLVDEIADCKIMIAQIESLYMISEFEIRRQIDFKLNRQLERIGNEVRDE
jgi:hypothetical protein